MLWLETWQATWMNRGMAISPQHPWTPSIAQSICHEYCVQHACADTPQCIREL